MPLQVKRRSSREGALKFLFQQEFLHQGTSLESQKKGEEINNLNLKLNSFFTFLNETKTHAHIKNKNNPSQSIKNKLKSKKVSHEYSKSLIEGVYRNKEDIDSTIKNLSHSWSKERIHLIDLNILRLAIYEIYLGGIPPRVAINEAIDMSKKYSTKDSSAFINGILDKVMKNPNLKIKKISYLKNNNEEKKQIST